MELSAAARVTALVKSSIDRYTHCIGICCCCGSLLVCGLFYRHFIAGEQVRVVTPQSDPGMKLNVTPAYHRASLHANWHSRATTLKQYVTVHLCLNNHFHNMHHTMPAASSFMSQSFYRIQRVLLPLVQADTGVQLLQNLTSLSAGKWRYKPLTYHVQRDTQTKHFYDHDVQKDGRC